MSFRRIAPRLVAPVVLAALAGTLTPFAAARAQAGAVTNVVATTSPTHYTGPCPGLIRFAGTIWVSGPTSVSYRWERSDGVIGAEHTLFIPHGAGRIETTWRLGTGARVVRGSQRLRVLSPGDIYSSDASFAVACGAAARLAPWGSRPGD